MKKATTTMPTFIRILAVFLGLTIGRLFSYLILGQNKNLSFTSVFSMFAGALIALGLLYLLNAFKKDHKN